MKTFIAILLTGLFAGTAAATTLPPLSETLAVSKLAASTLPSPEATKQERAYFEAPRISAGLLSPIACRLSTVTNADSVYRIAVCD